MENEMEVCVNCGDVTDCPVNEPIEFRKTYVEGAGQLCGKCYNETYDKRPK